MSDRIVILDPAVTADRFKAGADEMGWTLLDEFPAGKDTTYELVYRSTADGNMVHYVEDHFVRVRYALARGKDADEVAADIAQLYPHEDSDDVLVRAEKKSGNLQEMVNWLMSATVLGDQAGHKRLAKLVEKRLAHENRAVRRAALISVGWLEWPDFRTTVERMAKDDPAEDVREDAENLAESYGLRDKGKL